jgi:hypothetical protein
MEAVWNYFFWQTLSINMLDDEAHILRAGLTVAEDCINFENSPPRNPKDHERFEKCNSYLGPSQPGVLTADPLDDSANPSAARVRAQAGQPASRAGEQRGEGEPEAGPLPGQRDLSKPQIVVPPDVQRLLDSLTPRQRRRLESGPPPSSPDEFRRELEQVAPAAPADQQSTVQLLDYLFAP